MGKRRLSFMSLPEVAEEIGRLSDRGYTPLVRWNLTQCCEHLDKTMRVGMDGGMAPLPWIMRATVLRVLTDIVIASGWMPGGGPAPPEIAPGDRPQDDPAVIDACLATLDRAARFEGPLPPYPICNGMTLSKWKRLMCVHSAHHLGNLQPSA